MSTYNTAEVEKKNRLGVIRQKLDNYLKKLGPRVKGGEEALFQAIEDEAKPSALSEQEWKLLHEMIDDLAEVEAARLREMRGQPEPRDEQQSILAEAAAITNGRRNEDYGPPHKNFSRIAKMWSVIFDKDVTPAQVGLAMIALKMSRACASLERDHFVDIAGYARCAWDVIEAASEEATK
jgi:hypothetical protein